MKKKWVIIVCIVTLLLTGCWNRKELKDLGMIMGIGIDKVDDHYYVSAQIVNPGKLQKEGSSEGAAVTTINVREKTIFQAFRKLTTVSSKKLYFSHMRILVFGEQVAQEGLREEIDFFLRDHEIRSDFYVVVAKDTRASNVLQSLEPFDNIPSDKLFKSLESSEQNWAQTMAIHLDDWISTLISDGKEPTLTGLETVGDQQKGKSNENLMIVSPAGMVKYATIGVFQDDRLIGWLDEDESRGFNYIQDNIKSTIEAVPCEPKEYISIEIIRNHTKMIGKLDQGRPKIELDVKGEGNIGEVACVTNLASPNEIAELEQKVEKQIKENIEKVIQKLQKEYQSDIFGFGEAIQRSHPKEWKRLIKQWQQEFVDLDVVVHVDVKLRRVGKVSNSFLQEIK